MGKIFAVLFFIFTIQIFSQNAIRVEKVPCFLEACKTSGPLENLEFGYLYVPENYQEIDGKFIKIAFSIIKSTASNPKPDPILFFQGGWGMPEVLFTPQIAATFPIKDRDIILYDYRGSGFSTPSVCPNLANDHWQLILQDLNYAEFSEKINEQSYQCLETLNDQNLDYQLYGNETKTRDALMLVEQLGYTEVNLFGISNGTMAIQGFIRAAENSKVTVRSIFSDSNVPMAVYAHSEKSRDYKSVLDKILDDCARDPNCNEAYPNLKNRFYDFLHKTLETPLVYQGKELFIFNNYEINSVVHQLLYSYQNYKDIPLLLETLMSGDLEFFDQLWNFFERSVIDMNGTSLINYVYDWKAGQRVTFNAYQKNLEEIPEFMITDFWLDLYVKDTLMGFNARDTLPVKSSAPALILAGSYDPVTPPYLSSIMTERYANHQYFVLPKIGHGAFYSPCGMSLYKEFLAQPSQKIADSCVVSLQNKPILFTTSVYKNTKANNLFIELVIKNNLGWLAAFILPLIISLFLVFKEIISFFRKRKTNYLRLLLSFLVLLFLGGIAYYCYEASNAGGLLFLFGLRNAAFWLPWIPIAIAFTAIIGMLKWFRKMYFWNLSILASVVLTLWIAFNYGFVPF